MAKKTAQDATSTDKEGVSLKKFADEIGVKPDRLLSQFTDAGIKIASVDEFITQDQKQKLLAYLQQHHGGVKQDTVSPDKIVLRRAKTSEIKLGGSHGAGKTVSIQVRKKRTYVKRPAAEEEAKTTLEEISEKEPSSTEASTATTAAEAVSSIATEAPATQPAEPVSVTYAEDVIEQKVEEKPKPGIKRKEKHRLDDMEDAELDRNKKKKKVRDNSRDGDRKLESLLSRGADLSRVLNQDEEDAAELALRRSGKLRASSQAKIKVQAFTKPTAPIVHEVEIPETILLSELAQRMSVKGAEVI